MLLSSGCETISQDLTLLANTLTPPTPSEAAVMMVDPYNPDHRREGTVWIANSPFGGEPQYIRFYRESIDQEDDPTVLAVSIRALGRHGSPDDAPLIASRLEHRNDQVRWEAAKALQRLHNPTIVTGLLNVLRNQQESPMVRTEAADALGQYPHDRVFQALVAALDSRHLALNMAAEQSLSTLTGQSLGLDSSAWSRWYNAQQPAERFAGRQDYYYPTYMRARTFLERIAFWSARTFESPGIPAGMEPASRRRTYENDDQAE